MRLMLVCFLRLILTYPNEHASDSVKTTYHVLCLLDALKLVEAGWYNMTICRHLSVTKREI